MFPSWYIAATEASSPSGGLVVIWDPRWVSAKTFRCLGGILISANFRGCSDRIHILNVYAPYKDRASYWDLFIASGILENEALLIMGDLNCTMGPDEVWGRGEKANSIGEKIKEAMMLFNYVDICLDSMSPTWDNGRLGDAYIAKILDRFIMHEQLIEKLGIPTSNTLPVFISDHRTVSLQWMNSNARKGYPFKFNRYWLEEEAFATAGMTAQAVSWNTRAQIWELEKKKQNLLKIEEISWKLKSRITWMKEGDKNTEFFHRFASKRRAVNSIWQIKNEEGDFLFSQEGIANEAVSYFKKAHKREAKREFNDILWGIDPFSSMFNDEDNERLFAEISEEELFSVMKTFKKDKCPRPDG
eukprot:PITA_08693